MKIVITKDERWPDYSIEDYRNGNDYGKVLDIPDEKIQKWNKIVQDYNLLQAELQVLSEGPRPSF